MTKLMLSGREIDTSYFKNAFWYFYISTEYVERTGTHKLSANQTHVIKTFLQDDVLIKSSLLSSGFIYPMYCA